MHFVYSKIINTMKALIVLCKPTARQIPGWGARIFKKYTPLSTLRLPMVTPKSVVIVD